MPDNDAKSGEHASEKHDGSSAQKGKADTTRDYPLPKIDFSTFIFSLNSSALVHLGMVDDPGTGERTKNLPMAKQTIDVLAMLQEKTKGNLTGDEESMLRNILYDLRMHYVREKG